MAEESFADVHVTRCHASNVDIWWVLFTSLNSSTKTLVTRHNANNIGVQQKLVKTPPSQSLRDLHFILVFTRVISLTQKRHPNPSHHNYWCSRGVSSLWRKRHRNIISHISVQEDQLTSGEALLKSAIILVFNRTSLALEKALLKSQSSYDSVQEEHLTLAENDTEIPVVITAPL